MNRAERKHGHRAGGFTLIEVLVTIAVLLVTLPVIVQGFTQAAQIASLTRQRAEATALAQTKMDEYVATGEWQQGGGSGEETYRDTVFTWTVSTQGWDEANVQQLVNVQQLDATVTWTFRGSNVQQQVQLSTVVYLPDTSTTVGGTTLGVGLP